MKKDMNSIRVLVMMVALMWGVVSGAWAQLTSDDIEYEVKPSASAGTIEKSVDATTREVTLTVTPATGYYIKASDIVVEKLVNTGKANAPRRRTPAITDVITGKLYSGSGRTDEDIISSVENPNSAQYVFTVPADYDGVYVTAKFTSLTAGGVVRITRSTNLGTNPDMSAHYILVDDISASVVANLYSTTSFTGIFEGEAKADGSFPTISGLTHALFQTIEGNGTVKNIVLDNVNIAGSNYYTSVTVSNQSKKATGAIANVATGASRIYNCGIQATGSSVTIDDDGYTQFCTTKDAEGNTQHTESSSTVSGVDYVGGLVGFLDGTARVINCYSYADITSGSVVGGIVGRNNVATTASNQKTMVMNCMFYGNLTSGNKAPIYNGEIITNVGNNTGVSNFNYFWAGAPYVQNRIIDTYNCALTAETRYLQRFEFFRHLLNGHRELAAWWVQGDGFDKDEMAKWVMEPSQIGTTTPYPILKSQGKYPSVVNYKPSDETIDANNEHYNEGRKLGTLSVTIRMGTNSPYNAPSGARLKSGQSMTLTLPITDKDPAHFNFNYGKVQLPYYNDYGIGNYTGNRVVTGWKIVGISGGTAGSYSTDNDNNPDTPADATASVNDGDITLTNTPYNFADRKCTDKDKFEVSGRVFSQGAYFDVPEGVSSIIIEPYWAKAVFLADASPDLVYDTNMETAYNVPNVGGNQLYTNGNSYLIAGESQVVYTTASTKDATNAITGLFSGINENTSKDHSVYDYAIVLVGNYHHYSPDPSTNNHNINGNKNRPYTLMSIDNDHDNEPDYSLILRYNGRTTFHPIRFDFLNIPGLGMAQKSTGGKGTYNLGIMQTLGWFESTNTSLFRFTQFEYDKVGRQPSPMILQGGVIEQWVTMGQKESSTKEGKTVTYYHVGGNVWFKEFHIGVHQDKTQDEFVSPHPPISVTGGDYSEFYLTGMYNTPNNNYDDNAECYINGGRFGKVAGTGMQGIGGFTMSGTDKVSYSNGNITWQIDHADINEFYGGGINAAHIAEGNIMTVISNSRVDQFCGGPKFGNMNSDKKVATNATNCTFRTFFGAGYGGNSYNRRYPNNQNNKININWNTWVQGNDGLKYRYDSTYGGVETRIDYQFLPMSSNKDNVCRLYVDYVSFSLATTHDVTSKLTDCTITTSPLGSLELFSQSVGNFYGGGNLGMVDGPVKSTLTNCTVEGNVFGGGYSATLPTVAVMNNSFQTEPRYDENLGAYLEAELPTTVAYTWQHRDEVNSTATAIDTDNHILYTQETLTGLGAVTGNVTLTIDGNTTLTNGKRMSVSHSVYGGGEESNVEGNTQVNIIGGTITENVFGGGKGKADNFTCDKAMVGDNDAGKCEDPDSEDNKNKGTIVNITNGTVNGNVYGGGEVGRVEWNTQVKIGVGTGTGTFAPEINGSVFGAGKGEKTHGYAALVRGNSSVTIGGSAKVRENVYGGGEQATVGRYWVKGISTTLCPGDENETVIPTAPSGLPNEMPYKTRRGGKCTVIVQGSAQIGPDAATNVSKDAGQVFGAGKGVTPDYVHTGAKTNWSKRMVDYNPTKHTTGEGGNEGQTWDYYVDEEGNKDTRYVWEYFADETKYFEFLQSLALVTGTDVTINGATIMGNVYGGSESGFVQDDTNVKIQAGVIGTSGTTTYGNVYGGGKGLEQFAEAGKVKGNTEVAMSGGTAHGNVYGGGEVGDVGTINKTDIDNYTWSGYDNEDTTDDTGKCKVSITNAAATVMGDVFGAGKGSGVTFQCEKAMVYNTEVTISAGTVNGNVYGGGEVGRVENNSKVKIGNGEGSATGTVTPVITKNVFGAGKGWATHGYSALVRGNTEVTVEGNAKVGTSVYGGGEIASVGRYGLNADKMPNILLEGGECRVTVQGYAVIGPQNPTDSEGNVFGAGRGDDTPYNDSNKPQRMTLNSNGESILETINSEEAYKNFLETLALATHPEVTIDGNATVNGSVFGGGELGLTKGSVEVTINNGTIEKDVYGGGALAHTNTTNQIGTKDNNTGAWEKDANGNYVPTTVDYPTTTVRLLGGTIGGEAYGGGLGDANTAAYVYGDVLVDLNGTTTSGETGTPKPRTERGCVVAKVFGCNNINGTPKRNVMVHVYGTQHSAKDNIRGDVAKGTEESDKNYLQRLINVAKNGGTTIAEGVDATVITSAQTAHDSGTDAEITTAITAVTAELGKMYDVTAVYGGGDNAAYIPETAYTAATSTGSKTKVIIEGCDYSSIQYVYGGGNAAPVPDTDVLIKGTKIIDYVFGGGNGTVKGADVGYYMNGTTRVNQGDGNAKTTLMAGTIHNVYGGSNTNGDIRGEAIIVKTDNTHTENQDDGCCDKLVVNKMYSAGKDADISGGSKVILGCMEDDWIEEYYGGAENANVLGDVELTITSGKFRKVFGGNKTSGAIFGHIKVNIEETGCIPIEIDELYGCGNEAPYSIYGYYATGTNPNNGKTIYTARKSASDGTPVKPDGSAYTNEGTDKFTAYGSPEVNIISATRIGKVFGGGLGSNAIVYGNPTVNINQIFGLKSNGSGGYTTATDLGTIGADYTDANSTTVKGGVFGGGNEAAVNGNTTVNIGQLEYVEMTSFPKTDVRGYYTRSESEGSYTYTLVEGAAEVAATAGTSYYKKVLGANIAGNVYGGGNLADVTGKTYVNICAKETGTGDNKTWTAVAEGTKKVTIAGNVYGGGKGVAAESGARAFYCEEAMVGKEGTNSVENNNKPAYADYGTHVRIGNGTVGTLDGDGKRVDDTGNVYGGGEIGRVEFHTDVMIGFGGETKGASKTPVIYGSVFGAGKGTNTHGYSGLVRGNSKVTVQGDAKVGESVYGGGEMASVGKYQLDANGLPKTPVFGGKCTVSIGGYAEIGPDGMKMDNSATTGKPDDTGHVFGAGKGTLPYENVTGTPWSMELSGKVTYGEGKESDYYKFIQSLGLASNSDVTIDGHAFVKGSVYGGSENGYLQANTHVTIAGGQIGEGLGQTAPYADAAFIDPTTTTITAGATGNALATCATWTYDKVTTGKPYDKYATYLKEGEGEYYYDAGFTKSSKGGAPVATDGHTYYGNVFGGGRGVVPFAAGKWHRAAGSVAGTTQVDITGGHILSSVYGGNEHTDVGSYALGSDGEPTTNLTSGGTCTINISGGTVGVPRTKEQIEDNPVIGNVFGAGKGDKRVLFNTWTNVGATSVNISGDTKIYGSVFGGGEDGHVMNNAVTKIGGTVTTGVGDNTTSRNYTKVVIGSTGATGADGNVFGGGRGSETALTAGVVGGNVNLTIDKGNIMGNVYGGGRLASVGTNFTNPTLENGEPDPRYGELQTPDADHGNIIVTVNDGTIGSSTSTGVNGNIFGGSKGTETNWKLGIARSTTVNMTGGTAYASVYGGGELAQVVGSHTTSDQTLGTEINISGGTIGISGKGEATWGNVYGGGKGNTTHIEAGLVKTNTKVTINSGTNGEPKIYHNIYGGGAYGSVGTIRYGNATYVPNQTAAVSNMPTAWERAAEGTTQANTGTAEVYVYGGTIGTNGNENGMVFGSSRGDVGTPVDGVDPNNRLAWVYNTKVVIGGEGKSPIVYGSVYGSGENGHVFKNTQVEIHNGTIGVTADDSFGGPNYRLRGNVYGGGCGEDTYPGTTGTTKDHFNPLAGIVLGTTNVTIDGGQVVHNVYGAGALGSATNTSVTIAGNAVIGVSGKNGGNVFGAARGKEGITIVGSNLANSIETAVNINGGQIWGSVYGGGETGNVKQDVNVSMTGGAVAKDVYGGGALAHTQTANWDMTNATWLTDKISTTPNGKTTTTYKTHVSLTGGTITGDAYGGALGRKEYGTKGQAGYESPVEATVYGDVLVELNGKTTVSNGSTSTTIVGDNAKGCIVNRVFGCNNLNGTPKGKVKVYVYATQKNGESDIVTKAVKNTNTYDVQAVYGGGNLAVYEPVDATLEYNDANKARVDAAYPEVVIDGCKVTSIKQVYGGGNAASVPATFVEIRRCYEIDEVFGGGNGYDPYILNGNYYVNPGANVGYYNYTTPQADGTIVVEGTTYNKYKPVDNATPDCSTKDKRVANYSYGSGIARLEVTGGMIHTTYGGSNAKGNIRVKASSSYSASGDCDMQVDQSYGGGKDAPIDGEVEMVADCAHGIKEMFGGSKNADVDNDINLVITNGSTLERVFGGNNTSGAINGSITVTIEEGGCEPIVIDELYLGGYLAPYSVYGYKKTGGVYDTEDVPYIENNETKTHTQRIPLESGANPKKDPRIYVISASHIGDIYGGGYQAKLVGNPHVNVNMKAGKVVVTKTEVSADDASQYKFMDETDNKYYVYKDVAGNKYDHEKVKREGGKDYAPLAIGKIGNIYGGGNMADIIGDTYVEIGTGTWHNADGVLETEDADGNKWTYNETSKVWSLAGGSTTSTTTPTPLRNAANITGNVFGGGKGKEDTFECEKAMVGKDGDGKTHPDGGTNVIIGNGTVGGNVYGGGEVGRVEKNTVVTIGLESGSGTPVIAGNVFGAGAGKKTHGYSALVRGNSSVTIQGSAKVKGSVYGGGEIATVGRYTVDEATGMPTIPDGGGLCTVVIKDNAVIGPDANMVMNNTTTHKPDDAGHVFGAGKGVLPYEGYKDNEQPFHWDAKKVDGVWVDDKKWYKAYNDATASQDDIDKYFTFIKTLALVNETSVTIGGNALVKGGVYGGSENGFVQTNTNVTIQDNCQIGLGKGQTAVYSNDAFINPATTKVTADNTLAACDAWPYGQATGDAKYAPYDPNALTSGYYSTTESDATSAKGGYPVGDDGHTFYGNVFAGGSGYYPYRPGKWFSDAGQVRGNANLTITGGHILSNVYGGNEMTDVLGNSTITMSGGTIGVPRDAAAIAALPTVGHLYGAGKGDKRIFFNTSTNVNNTTVNITGGTIYGNVYGGGEDGHVLGDAVTTISQAANKTTVIGSTGTSGFDGDVFGGGQGSVTALTAGVVGGNVNLNVLGGSILGSTYGGGRIASVGTYFTDAGAANYGKMQEDANGVTHGHIAVNLIGGTIRQNVYGGCMGTAELDANNKPQDDLGVSKTTTVNLNGVPYTTDTETQTLYTGWGLVKDEASSGTPYVVPDASKGCVVKGSIFGCNNVYSSPQGAVLVHVYKTQRDGATRITNGGDEKYAKDWGRKDENGNFILSSFDVQSVYGGGNLAAYEPVPTKTTGTDEEKEASKPAPIVIIDGCGRTSIGHVYGGGNAAPTPATNVTVNGTFEIGELFGGGNGADKLPNGDDNPGANVGFRTYPDNVKDKTDTPENRATHYGYGSGKAAVNVFGGTIHRVFGGSNTKGNVRQSAITLLEEAGGCDFCVDEAYGGGKSAPMDAEAKLLMACIPGLKAVYGGAQAADVYDDVTVTVTNGNFDRVFGGNNLSGTIRGKITVNVEETGCRPVIIGELYGGGNQAGYSIYGYNEDGSVIESGETPLYQDPQVNVRSFTSIGNIYGGGYGKGAKMVGNPTVNINVVEGDKKDYTYDNDQSTYKVGEDNVPYYDANGFKELTLTVDDHSVVLPSHTKGKIGAINNVFGGGNAAEVIGNTNVNVGTLAEEYQIRPVAVGNSVANYYTRSGEGTESSPYKYTQATGNAVDGTTYYEKKTVIGADIRGNVYGGGNNAAVTGNTNVTIGKETTTTSPSSGN